MLYAYVSGVQSTHFLLQIHIKFCITAFNIHFHDPKRSLFDLFVQSLSFPVDHSIQIAEVVVMYLIMVQVYNTSSIFWDPLVFFKDV